jgi:hypothetical protein
MSNVCFAPFFVKKKNKNEVLLVPGILHVFLLAGNAEWYLILTHAWLIP